MALSSSIVPVSMIRIGVIGYGYWGPNIVRNLVSLPRVTVSWVSDINPTTLRTIPRLYPTIRVTQNTSDVFDDPKTDAVIIVTPPSTHFPLALKALKAKKHVLVEKPMTTSPKDAAKLIALAARNKKILMVDHTFVYTPAIMQLKKIIQSGTLGEIRSVDSVRTNLGLFQKDSNVISDLAVHDFSIMDYLFRLTPTSISATGLTDGSLKQETVAYVSTHYGKRVFLHTHVSWLSPIKIRRMIFVGTKKMAVYDDMEPSEKIKIYDKSVSVTKELRVGYRSGAAFVPRLGTEEALSGLVREFTRAIVSGKQPRTDGTQGFLVVRCIEAATKSLRSGGKSIRL